MKFAGPINISSKTDSSATTAGTNNLANLLTPSIKKQFDSLVSNICASLGDMSNSSGIQFYELAKALKEHILFDTGVEIATNHYSYLIDNTLSFSREDIHSGDGVIRIKPTLVISKPIHVQLKNMSVKVNKELLDISQVTGIPVNDIGNLFFNNLNSFVINRKNAELVDNSFISKIPNKIKKALTFNPIIISNGTKGNSASVNKSGPM